MIYIIASISSCMEKWKKKKVGNQHWTNIEYCSNLIEYSFVVYLLFIINTKKKHAWFGQRT